MTCAKNYKIGGGCVLKQSVKLGIFFWDTLYMIIWISSEAILIHLHLYNLHVLLDACWIDGLGNTSNTSLVKPSQNDLCWSPPQSTSNWDDTFIFQHRFLFLHPASATGFNLHCCMQWLSDVFHKFKMLPKVLWETIYQCGPLQQAIFLFLHHELR